MTRDETNRRVRHLLAELGVTAADWCRGHGLSHSELSRVKAGIRREVRCRDALELDSRKVARLVADDPERIGLVVNRLRLLGVGASVIELHARDILEDLADHDYLITEDR
jgi:hypothetical protein